MARFTRWGERHNPRPRTPAPEPFIEIDGGESYHQHKMMIRDYLTDNGWKKCNLCRKIETYKTEINGEKYQIKFLEDAFSFDKAIKQNTWDGVRTNWVKISQTAYPIITGFEQIITVLNRLPIKSTYVMTEDDKDNEAYLTRMGVKL